jgi:pyruvate dehydrogenase E2 component (dihydrolipoamide acetyltransferase)
MASEVRLPQWGMGMQEGMVARWLKQAGDRVEAGEELVEIEAAKVTDVITAPVAGVLLRILVAEGETVPVRTVLALVGAADEALPDQPGDGAPRHREAAIDRQPPGGPEGTRVQITPVARRMAKEHGIDLALVRGSGPGGRIGEADVQAYRDAHQRPAAPQPRAGGSDEHEQRAARSQAVHPARAQDAHALQETALPAAPPPAEPQPVTGMRRTIARQMVESLHTMAQLTLWTEVDVTELVRLRERLRRDFELTYTDLLVQAVAHALEQHPALNASLVDDRIHRHAEIHIGLAVALADGLIVPVIREANRKRLSVIARETKDLAARAHTGQLGMADVTGATFTITNLGQYGIEGFTPIINPPEAAILGIGRIAEKPACYRGSVVPRHLVTLSLTHDHRLVDGAPAAAFLRTVAEMLETPYLMHGA